MALLHYFLFHAAEYGIDLCALNCDHGIRGEASAADSAFVKDYCEKNNIPLLFFKNSDESFTKNESQARSWRTKCYIAATITQTLANGKQWKGAAAVATAHHLCDNAETVLFNIARGSGLSGAEGITDTFLKGIGCSLNGFDIDTGNLSIIHPLIAASREEIDKYINDNAIPYVTDESNFTDDYTRNKIRHNVIPALEDAVPGAQGAIYRFSRIVGETEEYFDNFIEKEGVISGIYGGKFIKVTEERAVFSRAVLKVLTHLGLKDYTSEHISRLYDMQFGENGKKFEFLGVTAYKEEGGLAICLSAALRYRDDSMPFKYSTASYQVYNYVSQPMVIAPRQYLSEDIAELLRQSDGTLNEDSIKVLQFDFDKVPDGAVVRFKREGDKFTKFGGGTKGLGDYFTDKKIPARLRGAIPLVADGNNILIIGGVEISDGVKITDETANIYGIVCRDYKKI